MYAAAGMFYCLNDLRPTAARWCLFGLEPGVYACYIGACGCICYVSMIYGMGIRVAALCFENGGACWHGRFRMRRLAFVLLQSWASCDGNGQCGFTKFILSNRRDTSEFARKVCRRASCLKSINRKNIF